MEQWKDNGALDIGQVLKEKGRSAQDQKEEMLIHEQK